MLIMLKLALCSELAFSSVPIELAYLTFASELILLIVNMSVLCSLRCIFCESSQEVLCIRGPLTYVRFLRMPSTSVSFRYHVVFRPLISYRSFWNLTILIFWSQGSVESSFLDLAVSIQKLVLTSP